MMKLQNLCAVVLGMTVAASTMAGPMRPTYTKENQFPQKGHYEVGSLFQFTEMGDIQQDPRMVNASLWEIGPYARYMATKNLAMGLALPVGGLEPDTGDSEFGLGDLRFNFELRAFEDLFGFPYIIPHLSVGLDTGDDDVGIGAGENSARMGVTFGSAVYDTDWYFNFDVSVEVFDESDNVLALGGSTIYALSEEFSVLAELQYADSEYPGYDGAHPIRYAVGIIYAPSERLTWLVEGAGAQDAREDGLLRLRIAYDI